MKSDGELVSTPCLLHVLQTEAGAQTELLRGRLGLGERRGMISEGLVRCWGGVGLGGLGWGWVVAQFVFMYIADRSVLEPWLQCVSMMLMEPLEEPGEIVCHPSFKDEMLAFVTMKRSTCLNSWGTFQMVTTHSLHSRRRCFAW